MQKKEEEKTIYGLSVGGQRLKSYVVQQVGALPQLHEG